MSAVADAMIELLEAGVVPVFDPKHCPDLVQDGEHGLVFVTITTRSGETLRLSGLLPADAECYLETAGPVDTEVSDSMRMAEESVVLRRFLAPAERSITSDYHCHQCAKKWAGTQSTADCAGRRAPCPNCREMCRPVAMRVCESCGCLGMPHFFPLINSPESLCVDCA